MVHFALEGRSGSGYAIGYRWRPVSDALYSLPNNADDLLLFMIIYKYPYLENHIIFSLAAVLEHVITARLR